MSLLRALALWAALLVVNYPQNVIGLLLGALGLLGPLGGEFVPILFSGVYTTTVGSFPQAKRF